MTERATPRVLQICPYEPPASGWVRRIKLLRQVIEQRGGRCEVLDIGPGRRLRRPGCIAVDSGADYLAKVRDFARRGYTVHTHVNGEYFRGILLALAASLVFGFYGQRRVCTFHAGHDQPFLTGWRALLLGPLYRLLFASSDALVCNSDRVKEALRSLARAEKINPIAAFSRQYLDYRPTPLAPPAAAFCQRHSRLASTYLCFRDGFFTDVVIAAMRLLRQSEPGLGLIIVGTGPQRAGFEQALIGAGITDRVHLAGDLDHDAFLTLLNRSDIHLRTPVTDGVSATVLEALALGTPVVAADNGSRPAAVFCYRADDPAELETAVRRALQRPAPLDADRLGARAGVADTAAVEVDLLCGIESSPAA